MNWLINVSLDKNSMLLHFRSDDGVVRLRDNYFPYFYAITDNVEEIRYLLSQHPLILKASIEEKYITLQTKTKSQVVRITTEVKDYQKVISDLRKIPQIKELAETTIPHYFRYINDRSLTFFSAYQFSKDKPGTLFQIGGISNSTKKIFLKEITTPEHPELRVAAIFPKSGEFLIVSENKSLNIKNLDQIEDIDVLFSYGGDTFLRNQRGVKISPLGCFLTNCIHIDIKKDISFDIYDESISKNILELGKERLVRIMELSNISGAKPDIVARITPGKLNTYLHISAAKKNDYLIPDLKKSMERPKSLRLLRIMDKGGLIFYPNPGVYHNVAKCDFASMYPNIIVKYNISPETMDCDCSDFFEVPQAGWKICKKPGVIPLGIEKVLRRRLELKKLMKKSIGADRRIYDLRQKALKNILVTCFGYLGFSNFIFSNVECKECVMLYGREILQRTKEIADEQGLDVIYGIVDSVFVQNGNDEKYQNFVNAVSKEMNIELELDLTFKSIVFPSAKDGSGVASKYFGITKNGEIEARGISLRHSDAPPFIKEFQKEAVQAIFNEDRMNLEKIYLKYRSLIPETSLDDLAITKSIRKEEYKANPPHVVAYRLAPNNQGYVTYIYTKDGARPLSLSDKSSIDLRKYEELLERSMKELIMGL